MRCTKSTFLRFSNFLLFFLLSLPKLDCATVKDVFNLNAQLSARVPRDNKYYSGRYSSSSSNVSPLNRAIKPEDSPEAREGTQIPVEKRCTRCDSSYSDTRYPYESRSRYDDRRYSRDKYDSDDRRYDRYDDRRYYDRYDDRDRDRDRYDRYDKRPSYDRYDRDRYFDRFDRDRYDRDRPERDRYDRYDRDRYDRDYDRGFGYDNRGYDNRDRGWNDYQQDGSSGWSSGRGYYSGGRPESGSGYWGTGGGYASNWNYGGGRDDYRDREHYDYDGFKPWDETYRGTSGWDNNGRGYYFAAGVPEVGAAHWASRGEYTNNRKYGNNYRDRYYRSRDPYDGYKTSYLYGRPSSTTTDRPSNSGDSDSGVTQAPQQDSSSG